MRFFLFYYRVHDDAHRILEKCHAVVFVSGKDMRKVGGGEIIMIRISFPYRPTTSFASASCTLSLFSYGRTNKLIGTYADVRTNEGRIFRIFFLAFVFRTFQITTG